MNIIKQKELIIEWNTIRKIIYRMWLVFYISDVSNSSFYISDVSNSSLYIVKKNNIWFRAIHKNTHIIYITHTIYITHIIYLNHIIYTTHVLTHTIYITHMVKLIFKVYKFSDEIFSFIICFIYIKILTYYKKKQRKSFKKGSWKVQKSFWRRKREKGPTCSWTI